MSSIHITRLSLEQVSRASDFVANKCFINQQLILVDESELDNCLVDNKNWHGEMIAEQEPLYPYI